MSGSAILIPGLLGAGCTSVALELAKLTGFKVVNSELIIREIVSEKRISYTLLVEMAKDGEIDLEDLIRSIALDYVGGGNVIIEGRTALMVLDKPAFLKVFLYADRKTRAERVARRREISIEDAVREVNRSDEDRKRLVERLYRRPLIDPSLYDMVINTTGLAYDEVARLVDDAIRWKQSLLAIRK